MVLYFSRLQPYSQKKTRLERLNSLLIFVGKVGAYPRVENLNGALLQQAPAQLANNGQGCRGSTGTNNLAYYEYSSITAVFYKCSYKAKSVCPLQAFLHSLMFVGKRRAYPRVENLNGALLQQAPAQLANNRQGWKGSTGTNNLAYYEHS